MNDGIPDTCRISLFIKDLMIDGHKYPGNDQLLQKNTVRRGIRLQQGFFTGKYITTGRRCRTMIVLLRPILPGSSLTHIREVHVPVDFSTKTFAAPVRKGTAVGVTKPDLISFVNKSRFLFDSFSVTK